VRGGQALFVGDRTSTACEGEDGGLNCLWEVEQTLLVKGGGSTVGGGSRQRRRGQRGRGEVEAMVQVPICGVTAGRLGLEQKVQGAIHKSRCAAHRRSPLQLKVSLHVAATSSLWQPRASGPVCANMHPHLLYLGEGPETGRVDRLDGHQLV
jgi:hypothetical protein